MSRVAKVLVVGAGIGGLCAAVALRKSDVAVDLVEIKADWTVYGVGIIQPSNTLRALARIGLARACVNAGAGFPGWRICNAAGKLLFEAQASNAAAPEFPPINGIARPKLHRILIDAAEAAGVEIRLGRSISELLDDGLGVNVKFTDDNECRYDVVIGCDGLYSDMRRRLFADAPVPKYSGQSVWRYNLPRPSGTTWGALYFGADSKAGIVPMSPTLMYLLLVTQEQGNPVMAPSTLAAKMRLRMASYPGVVGQLREQITDPSEVVYRPMEHLLLPWPWYRGRVLLIGDAAHATTPHLAQGAAMAIEDAVLIGELLGSGRAIRDVFEEFMRRRYTRAKYVVDSSSQIASWEIEQWAGIVNPAARPGELLHEASLALMEDY